MSASILSAARSPRNGSPRQRLVSIGEAARMVACNPQTIRRAMARGEVQGIRTPGGVRKIDVQSLADCFGLTLPDEPGESPDGATDGSTWGYVRVSTDRQEKAGNLARQRERVEEYIKTNYPGEPYVIVQERASGINHDRKGLSRVIEAALTGKCKRLILEFPERLSRGSYGLLSRILIKLGVEIVLTRTGEQENTGTTLTDELIFDCLAMVQSVNGKIYGSRGRLKTRFIPPPHFKTRVAQLHSEGMSYGCMIPILIAEEHRCQNTNKIIVESGILKVLREVKADLAARRGGNSAACPKTMQDFIRNHCVIGGGKRAWTQPIYYTYVGVCKNAGVEPLKPKQFTNLFRAAIPTVTLERQSNGRRMAFGVALRNNENASRSWHAAAVIKPKRY